MVASTHWRMLIYPTGPYPSMTEMIMATTPGGAQAATGGTPIAGSTYPGYPVANAFDGNTGTIWFAAAGAFPEWIGYIFPTAVTLREIRQLTTYGGYRLGPGTLIQYSLDNGLSWLNAGKLGLAIYPDNNYLSIGVPINSGITATQHPYWRLRFLKTQNANATGALAEVVFASSPGGTHGPGNVQTGAYANGWPAEAAVNGSFGIPDMGGDYWDSFVRSDASRNAPPTMWVGYLFVTAIAVSEVRATVRNTVVNRGSDPSDLVIEWSDDGDTWTIAHTETGLTWTQGETKTFMLPAPVSTSRRRFGVLRDYGG